MYMLTTVDNPYNPATQFDDWYAFDETQGYRTCSFIARLLRTSYDLGDEMLERDLDDAVEDAVRLNPLGIYKKIEVPDDQL